MPRNFHIHKKTPIYFIRKLFYDEFNLIITSDQAKEIRGAHVDYSAYWMSNGYNDVTITFSPDVKRANSEGVWSTAYNTFWPTNEWNTEHFKEASKDAVGKHYYWFPARLESRKE